MPMLIDAPIYQPQALRDYQREAVDAVKAAWSMGEPAPLVAVATGGGKTTIIAQTLVEAVDPLYQRALVIAHTEEIIQQIDDRIANQFGGRLDEYFGIHAAPGIGIVMADNDAADARIVVATRQSLHPKRLAKLLTYGAIDTLVIDECFPSGTLVSGKPIEQYNVGDPIDAYDEKTGRVVSATVTHTFARPVGDRLCRIRVAGKTIVCTPNHPFLTQEGWKAASSLSVNDMVQYTMCTTVNATKWDHGTDNQLPDVQQRSASGYPAEASSVQAAGQAILLKGVLLQEQNRQTAYRSRLSDGELSYMRQVVCDQGASAQAVEGNGASVLLKGMLSPVSSKRLGKDDGSDKPQVCLSADEAEQSYEESCNQTSNADYASGSAVETADSRRQRNGLYRASAVACAGARLADGIPHLYWKAQGRGVSRRLQDRYCRSCSQSRNRSGRRFAPNDQGKAGGRAQNGISCWVGVESVEILQSTGDEEFGRLCPNGLVYNLEVTPYHTYLVEGVVVDNCHHAFIDNTYGDILKALRAANPDLKVVGVTATPARGNEQALGSVFSSIAYEWLIPDGISTGYLVPVTRIKVKTSVNAEKVRTARGDYAQGQLVSVLEAANWLDLCAQAFHEHIARADRLCLSFLPSVEMSRQFAERLKADGIAAAHLDGDTPKDERRKLLSAYKRGDLRVVSNMSVLTEGFDAPETSAIFLARPTRSQTLFTQIVGRGLRPFPGKHDCLLVDMTVTDTRALEVGSLIGRMITCRKCKTEYFFGMKACPTCGYVPERKGGSGGGEEAYDQFMGGHLIANFEALFEKAFAAWYTGNDGFLSCTLSFDDGAYLIIPPLEDEYYRLVHVPKDRKHVLRFVDKNEDLASLMMSADSHIRKYVGRTSDKEAAWRDLPATLAQVTLLGQLGVKADANLSKGMAQQLITHKLAVKRFLRDSGVK